MKLTLNREFLMRHLFSFAVFAALGGWFGLDAFVRYPATSGRDLYVAIEKSEPAEGTDLEAFKVQKIGTQRIFAFLTLLAAAGVGINLLRAVRFAFSFDDSGFEWAGKRYEYAEITSVDTSLWATKGLLTVAGKDWKIRLDAWHHTGVKDFYEKIQNRS